MQGSQWHRWLAAALALLGLAAVGAVRAEVAVGQPAPDFRLQDQNGKWHTLADHRGQWIVLYFYPKDQTPGCTKEACAFRDNIFAFEVTNLYGVMGGFGPIKLAKRQSFLIAPDGRIARHYASVEPEKHSAEVLADLKALGAKKSS
ncbi:MAG: peroxiredoxin [Proteobacteria bacterium]|nr:MAG: peroxiredoxin [Pseudomonadota bacterium]